MRFRASVVNIQMFFKIVQSIEKIQKNCFVKFDESYMDIICNNDTNEGGIQVWSKIKVNALFEDYRIQSNANNEITMSLQFESLLSALWSAYASTTSINSFDAEEIVMKLAKKGDQAVLTFELPGQTRSGQRVRVMHDVKIDIMKPADAERLKEPMCPKADLLIVLPSLQKLRKVIDGFRQMADTMALQANNNKKLIFSVRTDNVNIKTEWSDCTNVEPVDSVNAEGEDEPQDPDKMFSVYISIKSFLQFLNSHVISSTTIASICHRHCAILYVYLGDVADAGGVLTFYIPAIIDDEEEF